MGLLIIGIYLIAVGYQGNAGPLFAFLGEEGPFIPWAAAVGILAWLWRATPPPGKEPVRMIIGAGVLGAILIEASRIISDLRQAWASVEGLAHLQSASGAGASLGAGAAVASPVAAGGAANSGGSSLSPSSPLSQLVANIESGNNPNAPGGGLYQETQGFTSQFGGGFGGVANFTQQAVAQNPGLTLGDWYAEYNSGTGNPGMGNTWADLASINPAAYANASRKIAAAGLSPYTPVSQLY